MSYTQPVHHVAHGQQSRNQQHFVERDRTARHSDSDFVRPGTSTFVSGQPPKNAKPSSTYEPYDVVAKPYNGQARPQTAVGSYVADAQQRPQNVPRSQSMLSRKSSMSATDIGVDPQVIEEVKFAMDILLRQGQELGLNLNQEDIDFRTPLHAAAIHGKAAVVHALSEFGCPVETRDRGMFSLF